MSAPDFDLLAASLRADATDLNAFGEALAAKLEGAFPGRARVERAGGMLSRSKRVHHISVELGDERYEVALEHGRADARRCTVVRGIVLKNEPLALEEWIDGLSRQLVDEAERSGRGRAALERLLEG